MDQVVCINDDWYSLEEDGSFPSAMPKKDSIYTPLEIVVEYNIECYVLAEMDKDWIFDTDHFRPVKKTDIGDLTALLRPTNKTKKKQAIDDLHKYIEKV